MAFRVEALLDAAGGDREEALRMLFVLARMAADTPAEARATGPELAAALAALLEPEGPQPEDPGWTRARQMVTGIGDKDPTPTAATVADAIEEVLSGQDLALPEADARYAEEGLLGVGGMGRVLRVRDQRLDRSVALKALHSGVSGLASARRFLEEARLTAQLDHPNIVPLYELGQGRDGGLYFTMKEVQGRSLGQAIDDARHTVRREGADPTREILQMVRWFRQVCDGVGFAHGRGIAHRDLKPDNVMVGDFGEVQVMDWGLAKRFGSPVSSAAGTPHYMAPEVAWSQVEEVGPLEDVYALGATLYHLLCFEPPYEGQTSAVLERLRIGPPPPPSARATHPIPEELVAVALRAMARRPENRYPSVAELAEDVQAWLDGRPLASLSYGTTTLLAKWVHRNRPLVAGVGTTAGAAMLLGGFGAVRYVLDVTAARDVARERMIEAQLAAARASTETGRFGRAEELYRTATAELEALGSPTLGPQVGRLHNRSRAERPMFRVTPPTPTATLEIEPEHGWIYALDPGQPVVMRAPPRFAPVWRSSVPVPECIDRSARWEGESLVVYCATDQGVHRIDLGTGASSEVSALLGRPPLVEAPSGSDLLFVGHGDRENLHRDPTVRWRVVAPGPEGWEVGFELDVAEIPSAAGPWFLADRYGTEHGTVLYHVDRGPVRTVGLPRARGVLSPDGELAATYHEGRHELLLEPLQGGPARWTYHPEQPLVVHAFTGSAVLTAGSTGPTILELDLASGGVLGTFDGHPGPVLDVQATDDLVLSRGQEGDVLGYARHRPSDRVDGSVMGLVPPGRALVMAGGDRELVFLDLTTREPLRRVRLPLDADEAWEAESVQSDGALVVTARRILFVPLAEGPVEELVTADGRPLRSADRLEGGQLAFCRGSDVVLRDPDGTEHTLGRIEREECRDLKLVGPGSVYVSDFWGFAVHRFGLGTDGPIWTQRLENVVYRLSATGGRVAVGDLTGTISVFDADSGAVVARAQAHEGPVLGCALTSDGRYLASAGWDHRVAVRDLRTGRTVAEDTRHDVPVEWVGWTEDGRKLVSADPDGAVIRDLDAPDRLAEGYRVLTELAADPDHERTDAERAAVDRALAAHGWSEPR